MGLYLGDRRETSVCYISNNIGRIGPPIDESKHEFSIVAGSNYKKYNNKNIEDKLREQGKAINNKILYEK